jgi:hypothetical protein
VHGWYARRWEEAGKAPFRSEVEVRERAPAVEVSIVRIERPEWDGSPNRGYQRSGQRQRRSSEHR